MEYFFLRGILSRQVLDEEHVTLRFKKRIIEYDWEYLSRLLM